MGCKGDQSLAVYHPLDRAVKSLARYPHLTRPVCKSQGPNYGVIFGLTAWPLAMLGLTPYLANLLKLSGGCNPPSLLAYFAATSKSILKLFETLPVQVLGIHWP